MTASSLEVLPACCRRFSRRAAIGLSTVIAILFALGAPLYGQNSAAAPTAQNPAPQTTGRANGNSSAAGAGQQIDESQLVGLPLNGRSYNQLATLQAGVTDTAGASASRGVGGGSLTIAGGRATSNNFLLDGTNIMDAQNRVPRSAAGVQLGSDAVFQVQVLSTYYGPEHGRGAGGVVNSITHSGTPEIHGTAFEYLRNSKLDARNFFDPGAEPPPFKRNQFGATLTGPVRQASDACVQTCTAKARYFGDLDDPNSTVSLLAKSSRAFRLQEDVGTMPKTIYLREG